MIVSDITYIVLWVNPIDGESKFCYLSLVTDYYTKEIVGYSVGETLETRYTLEALEMAVRHYGKENLSVSSITPTGECSMQVMPIPEG